MADRVMRYDWNTGKESPTGEHVLYGNYAKLETELQTVKDELGVTQRTMKAWEDSYLEDHECWGVCNVKNLEAELSDTRALHASICDLIHKSQIAARGGKSHSECLEEIKGRLGGKG